MKEKGKEERGRDGGSEGGGTWGVKENKRESREEREIKDVGNVGIVKAQNTTDIRHTYTYDHLPSATPEVAMSTH